MKALLVIDVQNGIVNLGDFKEELSLIERVIKDFKENRSPVIFMRHIDESEESPMHRSSVGSELHSSLKDYADNVLEKHTPSSFFNTELSSTLEKLGVNHLFITGFETEFCCMFTAIAAFDRGYKVTFLKNAMGTGNTAETYDMQGLDINDFVGKVLKWSDAIEVLDYDKYVEKYKAEKTI
ncbi:isochorismatase family protein [Cytobacillus purgationiresistens]|uniref:Nicotinamidase-related amidase n=1 Tax=Cytobacillus purgationiresistens TaxID=863449 RepID=A0ABU0AM01_9BACI|nr:isochorismatase family protein [Cytobacillus purgationiresistens]MDQ0272296.1 nicotinamidase-related amidase [Cytobacillus purgationiresistens]